MAVGVMLSYLGTGNSFSLTLSMAVSCFTLVSVHVCPSTFTIFCSIFSSPIARDHNDVDKWNLHLGRSSKECEAECDDVFLHYGKGGGGQR